MCNSSTGSHKQSDLESSGSRFLSNKGQMERQATLMSLVEEDLDNGFTKTSVGEEGNSPMKKSPMKKLPV